MDIAIGATALLAPITGVGRYTAEVIRGLKAVAPEHAYAYHYGFFSSGSVLRGAPIRTLRFLHDHAARVRSIGGRLRRLRSCATSAGGHGYDVYFEPNFAPLRVKARRRVFVVHDLAFHLHPEWQPRDRVDHLRRRFLSTVRGDDVLVTHSQFTKDEAAGAFGTDGSNITVVPAAVDHSLFRRLPREVLVECQRRWRLSRRFVLSVGSLEPRKNLLRLLEAHAALPRAVRREHPLVLAGARGWSNTALHSTLRRRGDVRFLGYVSDEDLACLYNLATLFAFPSLYEGFGLPPLEAMACGAPTTTSLAGSLPEVVGQDGAYFDPTDTAGMTAVMQRLLEDDDARLRLSQRGLRRAARFTWADTSRGLLSVFRGEQVRAQSVPPAA